MRRTAVLLAVLAALLGSAFFWAGPAGASRLNQSIDPTKLALPQSALPSGTVIDHSGVSDNPDADGETTPPDGFKAQLRIAHQNLYEVLGRITGYRMDFHYAVQGAQVGTEYLASIFPSADKAKAAMEDAIGPNTLITIIGQPLKNQCSVGDQCRAYSGPNPGTPNKVVFAIFTDGPVLVETASQVPAAQFDQLEPAMEQTLFSFLQAADVQVKIALGQTSSGTNTAAPATATSPAATATQAAATAVAPVATDTPTPKPKKCTKNAHVVKGKCKCKKGYVQKKGKCVKKHK